jgi:hypothetical protein
MEQIQKTILEPTIAAMAAEGRPYSGVLYAGLMITADGPKVLEYNCRFGDPETQVVLPLLKTDLVDVIDAVIDGRLDRQAIEWEPGACCGVVFASPGYPGSYPTGLPIDGLDDLEDGVLLFHAGTKVGPDPRKVDRWAGVKRELMVDSPAPQAVLMKTIIEGVLSGALPWGLVLSGGGLAIGAMLCGVSGLAFAIGVYLPLASMAPIYIGGCLRAWTERRRAAAPDQSDPGILAAAGLVAGEGLAGVLVAALVALGVAPRSLAPRVPGAAWQAVAAAVLLGLGAYLVLAARPRSDRGARERGQ